MCGTPADVFKHPINTHTRIPVYMHTNKPQKKKKKLYSHDTNCRSFIPAMIDP